MALIVAIPADAVSDGSEANQSPQPTATVLIADDNRDVVEATAMLLRTANYAVICADSVQEVLTVLDERTDIDLVVSDIKMPEYTGFDLFRVMRYRWPNMPIVLVTGFNIVDSDVMPRGAVVVQKPFTLVQLDEAIKSQLLISRRGDHKPEQFTDLRSITFG